MSYTFKPQGGTATYALEECSRERANWYGCEGATHELVGRYGKTFGRIKPVTGKWTRRGMLVEFVPAVVAEDSPAIKGYIS